MGRFHNRAMYIAIEGCIGAGKTTVARALAHSRKAALLEEDFEANPFIRAFYKDPLKHALEVEFGFLLVHYHQLLLEKQFICRIQPAVICKIHFLLVIAFSFFDPLENKPIGQ